MDYGPLKVRKVVAWSPSSFGMLKFNINGALRSKSVSTGIGGVPWNWNGEVLIMLSKNVQVFYSNEAEVLAIWEGLKLFSRSNSSKAWVLNRKARPWQSQFHFNEIKDSYPLASIFPFIVKLDQPILRQM
eukprot:TRINITY_DN69303_c0_g1_i1.p1 TRINITY_DN69303_c0_g1~~TRINITY_DN69303_c0_g1_i1.p1  ORF type:complete len:130 (+),score=9.32 TRINITY_DN69303_c0_g1_i1:46-435(+)